ncbi:flagellar basal body-associated FliL family protein [Roseovarius sp. A-2]|uniref:flagellar basal body-associated FliL family protein n=1 Tax=Roseovarius sp. A-2 TaxID=1570360 RepID=UPI0035E44733
MLLPLFLALLGTVGGIAAGLVLRPAAQDAHALEQTQDSPAETDRPETAHAEETAGDSDFVRLNNQFVIPVVSDARIDALVVLSLSLEVTGGQTQTVYAREPKLRDGFLQVLFDHANMGGFDGEFTGADRMDALRRALRDVAARVLGETARDVLITEIARQDV